MSTPNPENRRMKFKNECKTTEEGRRRREDETVQLRKAKREKQVQKRGNITLLSTSSQDSQDDQNLKSNDVNNDLSIIVSDTSKTVEQRAITVLGLVKQHMHSEQLTDELMICIQTVRKLLSLEPSPPIQRVIDSGIVPKLIQIMKMFEKAQFAFEACWCITNIASGSTEQTQYLIDHNAHKALVDIVHFCQNRDIVEQAVWAIGNIAGDGAHFRDILLNLNVIKMLLEFLKPNVQTSTSLKRQIIWALSNLNRAKKPAPNFALIKPCIPVLQNVMATSNDREMLTDCCWAISYMTDASSDKVDAVISANIVPLLVKHLGTDDHNLQAASIRALGNIVSGTDEQTQTVLESGVLKVISKLLVNSSKQPVIKEICWTLSNILAGNQDQVQMVLDSGCLQRVTRLVVIGDQRTRKEAIWAVVNATSGATDSQMNELLEMHVVKYLCESLRTDDPRMILVAMAGLENCFRYGHRLAGFKNLSYNPVHDLVEECGGLDRLEYLQAHPNQEVFERVARLFYDWLVVDSDGDQFPQIAPQVGENGLFRFGANNENDMNRFNF